MTTYLRMISILAMLVFCMPSLTAQKYSYSDQSTQPGLRVQKESSRQLELTFGLTEFTLAHMNIRGESMQKPIIKGSWLPNDAGAPDLPVISRYVAIPNGAKVAVEVEEVSTETMEGVSIAPAAALPKDTDAFPPEAVKDQKIYQAAVDYPAQVVKVSDVHKIRGQEVVLVAIHPFQYNPVTEKLTIHTNLKINIRFEGGNGQFGDRRYQSRWWTPIIKDMVVNQNMIPGYQEINYGSRAEFTGAEYVIISPDDANFLSWADSIKVFRTRQGIQTMVVSLSEIGGNSTTAIENFVNDAYYNWDIPPSAILLMSDYGTASSGITSPIYDNYCISDNIYADVDQDHLPDVIFARMTARNASELSIMVNKFLNYERTPPTNAHFYDHPVTAMGWQTERWFQLCSETINGWFEYGMGKEPIRENALYSGSPGNVWSTATNTATIVNEFGESGLGYIPNTPSHLSDWGGNAARLNEDLNAGAFILQHRDHGSETGWGEPDYDINDINGLNNEDLCFVFSVNCLTGKFDNNSETFAEKFHRHPYGALGIIAATEVSYSFVNDTYVWGMYDHMWPDFMPDFSTNPVSRGVLPAFANAAGKYFLEQSSWPYNTSNKEVTYYLFHHHGDAFSVLYAEMPQHIEVEHNDVLLAGLDYVDIQAEAGSLICLSVDNQIIATATASGNMESVPILAQEPGSYLDIVVTKQDHYRYENSMEVIPPEGAYCIYNDLTINDENGNGNSIVEYDEPILLSLAIRNLGNDDGQNITVSIDIDDPYIDIIDGVEDYGLIESNTIKTITDGFMVQIADNVPNRHNFEINVLAQDGESSWNSRFYIRAYAPVLSAGEMIIENDDNGNGMLEPGETATLTLQTYNSGSCVAYNVNAALVSYNMYIDVLTDQVEIPVLGLLGSAYPSFEVIVSDQAPEGFPADMQYELSSGGLALEKMYTPDIGMIIEDWETGNTSKFNWQFEDQAAWEISSQYPFDGNFHLVSGDINHGQKSTVKLSYNVLRPDSIVFYRKVSSEISNDELRFFIDGNLQKSWSGTNQGWRREAYPVSSGNHVFKWTYSKNGSISEGADKAWIDNIMLPNPMMTFLFAGVDATICATDTYHTTATASNYESLLWSSSGSGSFASNSNLYTVYSPSVEDVENGEVLLSITLTNDEGEEITDEMKLSFSYGPAAPAVPSGPDVVDVYKDPITVYTIEPGSESMGSDWILIPENAGTLEIDEYSVRINWNQSFLGIAELSSALIDNCGTGEYSENLEIVILNTVFTSEHTYEDIIHILPNPNNGVFSLKINHEDFGKSSIQMYDVNGNLVYSEKLPAFEGQYLHQLDMSLLPTGIYYLNIYSNKGKGFQQKLIIF